MRLALASVHLCVVERCESGYQSHFKAHRPREQIAREHTPGPLTAAHIMLAGGLVDHLSELASAIDDRVHQHFGYYDRRTRAKAAARAVGYIGPAFEEREAFA